MANDNTHAFFGEVLDETVNRKLEEMMARILRAVGKQLVEENSGTSAQQ